MKDHKIRKIIAILEVVGDPDDGVVSVKTGCINGHGRDDIATISLRNCIGAYKSGTLKEGREKS